MINVIIDITHDFNQFERGLLFKDGDPLIVYKELD